MNWTQFKTISKEELPQMADSLTADDLAQLVEMLKLSDNEQRYRAFLLLSARCQTHDDVYPYWDRLAQKLTDANSYQRSIGVMLLAENVRWDQTGRMAELLPVYLEVLHDEKPITVRQTIQALAVVGESQPALAASIAEALMKLDITAIRPTMQKSILTDVLNTLIIIRTHCHSELLDAYLNDWLLKGNLDRKLINQLKARM